MAGVFAVTFPLPAGDTSLDCEDHYGRQENGIQWTLLDQLDDLVFADDLALLSQSCKQN
jgi:hypothetical protein